MKLENLNDWGCSIFFFLQATQIQRIISDKMGIILQQLFSQLLFSGLLQHISQRCNLLFTSTDAESSRWLMFFLVIHSPDTLSCGSFCSTATHRAPKLLCISCHKVPSWVRCEGMRVWEGAVCAFLLFRSASFLPGQAAAWKCKPSPLHHSDTHKHTFSEMFDSGGCRWNLVCDVS